MDLTFQVPMQYCSLQHQILLPSPVTSTTGCLLALAPSLHSFWSYFSTPLHYHTGYLLTWGVHLSMSYLIAFSYSSWVSQDKNTEVVYHSLLQWIMFSRSAYGNNGMLEKRAHFPTRKMSWSCWIIKKKSINRRKKLLTYVVTQNYRMLCENDTGGM